jgi:hypothetical protein
MKRLLVLVAVAAVISGYTSAGAQATTRPVSATLNGTATLIGFGHFGISVFLDGRGVVRGIGAVTFSGAWSSDSGLFPPFPGTARLDLTLTAANGDAIVLAGVTTWSDANNAPPLTWAVVSGTGRFAQTSGSGTYTRPFFGPPFTGTTSAFTMTLVGSLDI